MLALFNRQTPKHLEATAIAVFSSLFSLSKLVSTLLGALLGFAFAIHSSNYAHMYPIVMIQCIFTTLTTFCIFFIKFPQKEIEIGNYKSRKAINRILPSPQLIKVENGVC